MERILRATAEGRGHAETSGGESNWPEAAPEAVLVRPIRAIRRGWPRRGSDSAASRKLTVPARRKRRTVRSTSSTNPKTFHGANLYWTEWPDWRASAELPLDRPAAGKPRSGRARHPSRTECHEADVNPPDSPLRFKLPINQIKTKIFKIQAPSGTVLKS